MSLIPTNIQPYFVILFLVVVFFLIYRESVKPLTGFIITSIVFLISGILSPDEILAGFSNQSIASIALLILITAGIRNHFPLERLFDSFFKLARSYRQFLLLMMAKVSLLSSFVNNTPVVALMTPYVFNWGKKNNISPSKLLIPLSYATIAGGMITIIGTSTTLVLNGFLIDFGLPQLNAFDLLITGLPVTVGCIVFVVLLGHKLLPDNRDLLDKFESNKREYLLEKKLTKNSSLIGKSVSEAGLRNMTGVYLVEIIRANKVISPVLPSEQLESRDTLIFAGDTESVIDLTMSDLGIELPHQANSSNDSNINVIEAVIAANSSITGKSVKESEFRNRYDAAVVAIHRNGEKLSGKIGDIKLRSGDVLLLFAGLDFNNRVDLYKDIFLISHADKTKSTKTARGAGTLLGIALMALGLIPLGYSNLFTSLLLIISYMVATNLITLKTLKRDLDINMMLILVLSLGIGQAIIKTHAGDMIAEGLLNIFQPYGVLATLLGIMVITTLLTTFVTNVGAVAIMFPIALAISNNLNMADSPFYLAIAYAASAAFLSPIGYQTNMIIFGPGRYTFKDFLKIGIPVAVIYLTIAFLCICFLFKTQLLA